MATFLLYPLTSHLLDSLFTACKTNLPILCRLFLWSWYSGHSTRSKYQFPNNIVYSVFHIALWWRIRDHFTCYALTLLPLGGHVHISIQLKTAFSTRLCTSGLLHKKNPFILFKPLFLSHLFWDSLLQKCILYPNKRCRNTLKNLYTHINRKLCTYLYFNLLTSHSRWDILLSLLSIGVIFLKLCKCDRK